LEAKLLHALTIFFPAAYNGEIVQLRLHLNVRWNGFENIKRGVREVILAIYYKLFLSAYYLEFVANRLFASLSSPILAIWPSKIPEP